MFTEVAPVARYEKLIGARVIFADLLPRDRRSFTDAAQSCCGNLFLDPDTGLNNAGGRFHVSIAEFRDIVFSRPETSLTAIFDQSVSHGTADARRRVVREKLDRLHSEGVAAFAYYSHACFLIAGRDAGLIARVREHILIESGLPESCILTGGRNPQ